MSSITSNCGNISQIDSPPAFVSLLTNTAKKTKEDIYHIKR